MKQLFTALVAVLLLSTVACSKKDKNNNNNNQCGVGYIYSYGQCVYQGGNGGGGYPGQPGYPGYPGMNNHHAYCQYWAPQYQGMPNFMQQCLQYCQQSPHACY